MEGGARRFRLEPLLESRRDAERAAERGLADACRAVAVAEARQVELDARIAAADARRRSAVMAAGAPATAGVGVAHDAHRRRLADEARRALDDAQRHRDGSLRQAREAEAAARAALLEARREREALQKVKAREAAEARAVAHRRAEDAASDVAAAKHVGPRDE